MDNERCTNFAWLMVRLTLGFTMLWGFLDKAFGLGFKTCRDATTKSVDVMCQKAWFSGGSPTKGFLANASGPLGDIFKTLAASDALVTIINILFMLGLLGIGIALIFGAGLKIAGYSGAALMIFMYLAAFVPENNPIIDDHLVNAAVFLLIAIVGTKLGDGFGLGKWWKSKSFVQKYKWLE